jgi:hypothetical protein
LNSSKCLQDTHPGTGTQAGGHKVEQQPVLAGNTPNHRNADKGHRVEQQQVLPGNTTGHWNADKGTTGLNSSTCCVGRQQRHQPRPNTLLRIVAQM